jgi:uncharacterized LabA/DUF88 family protein
MSDRVVIFIDYQNLHGWARRLFLPVNAHPADGHVDPLRLAQLLVRRRRRPSALEGVRVYRGRPSPDHQPRAAAANDRQTAAWQRSGAVTVIRRPLRYPADWPTAPAQEKGIDVALAIDVVAMALRKEYDAAIVVSSDTDLMPAIETVYAGRLGHIELATWAGARRLRFPRTQLPWWHFISGAEYRTPEDLTDYTQVPGSE